MDPAGRDARLRRLAREAPDDPEVAARLLAERVRAGQATQADLRLLATLGHAAASEVLGERPLPPVRDLRARLLLLWDLGPEVGIRANVCAARFFLELWDEAREGREADDRPREAVEAAQRWLDAPEGERPDAATACVLAAEPARRAQQGAHGRVVEVLAARLAAETCALIWSRDVSPQARAAATEWATAFAPDLPEKRRPDAVWEAIQATLVPWALTRTVQPRTYSANETFAMGETLRHPRFGVGVVREVAGRSIVVCFEGDPLTRKLAHRPEHR